MGKYLWQKIKEYKLFIVLVVIIVLLVIVKFDSKTKTTTAVNTVVQTTKIENSVTNTDELISKNTPTPTIKKLSNEEISNLSEDDYFAYADTLTEEEQNNMPPLAFYVNEAFPYEGDTFLAEKYENLKVYAKYKTGDQAQAEKDLKYWYFTEIGLILPSENIVWEGNI